MSEAAPYTENSYIYLPFPKYLATLYAVQLELTVFLIKKEDVLNIMHVCCVAFLGIPKQISTPCRYGTEDRSGKWFHPSVCSLVNQRMCWVSSWCVNDSKSAASPKPQCSVGGATRGLHPQDCLSNLQEAPQTESLPLPDVVSWLCNHTVGLCGPCGL